MTASNRLLPLPPRPPPRPLLLRRTLPPREKFPDQETTTRTLVHERVVLEREERVDEVGIEVEDILLEVDLEMSSEEREVTRDLETLVRTLLRVRSKAKRDLVVLRRSESVCQTVTPRSFER